MTNQDAHDELADLALAHAAHGELAAMHGKLNTCEQLLMHDRDAEAEAMVLTVWNRCQEMHAAFMARPSGEYVARVLEGIEAAQDQSLDWLDIVRSKPPGWAERRRGEIFSHSQI